MTVKKFATCNSIHAALTKAQLMCYGKLPVQVYVQHQDGTKSQHDVLATRFNENSGNVELTVKE